MIRQKEMAAIFEHLVFVDRRQYCGFIMRLPVAPFINVFKFKLGTGTDVRRSRPSTWRQRSITIRGHLDDVIIFIFLTNVSQTATSVWAHDSKSTNKQTVERYNHLSHKQDVASWSLKTSQENGKTPQGSS